MAGSVRTDEDGLHFEVEKLRGAITVAVDHLADLDAEDDLEQFGRMLDDLIAGTRSLAEAATALGAEGRAWRELLDTALGHLREAHDLLDDGEPPDAVTLEVMAAGDVLRRRPGA